VWAQHHAYDHGVVQCANVRDRIWDQIGMTSEIRQGECRLGYDIVDWIGFLTNQILFHEAT
jgi:hypothetical protein